MVGFEIGPTLSDAGAVSRGLCQLDDEGRLAKIVEVTELEKRGEGGVYTDADGREVVLRGDEPVSMNMWGFTPELFPELRGRFEGFFARSGQDSNAEFLLPDVIQALMDEGRAQVEVLGPAGQWCGITFREDKDRTARFLLSLVESGNYPRRLWN